MKRLIGIAALLCVTIPCAVQATRIHDVGNSAQGADVWTNVGGRGSKDFIIRNDTGHRLYTRIAFNVCQAEAFSNFRSGRIYGVRKRPGCIPTRVSGYIWIDDKQVPLVEWRPGGNETAFASTLPSIRRRRDAAFGAGWVVRMNPDGKTATVYFAGGFTLARPGYGNDAGRDQRHID